MKIETAFTAHVGGRDEQQDAVTVLSAKNGERHLLVLADGMGGHAGGSLASRTVVETAERRWAETGGSGEAKAFLGEIVQAAHEAINAAGVEQGLSPRSTCVLLLVDGRRAFWAHVGDSRLYRFRKGAVAERTRDHSVVQMLLDMGKITEEEMGTHPDQNRLTQSLGGEADPEPDFGEAEIAEGDAFLMCSDGLWEMIEPGEMASAFGEKALSAQPDALAALAFDRAGRRSDNISVAMLRVGGARAMVAPAGATGAATRATTGATTGATIGAAATAGRASAGARSGSGDPAPRRSGSARIAFSFALVGLLAIGAAGAIVRPWEVGGPLSEIVPRNATTDPAPAPAPGPEPDVRRKLRPLPDPAERKPGAPETPRTDPDGPVPKAPQPDTRPPDTPAPDTRRPDAPDGRTQRPDAARPDAARPDSARPDSGRPAPRTDSDPAPIDPSETEPRSPRTPATPGQNESAPAQPDPGEPAPNRTAPDRTGPDRTGPGQPDSVQPGPAQPGPARPGPAQPDTAPRTAPESADPPSEPAPQSDPGPRPSPDSQPAPDTRPAPESGPPETGSRNPEPGDRATDRRRPTDPDRNPD